MNTPKHFDGEGDAEETASAIVIAMAEYDDPTYAPLSAALKAADRLIENLSSGAFVVNALHRDIAGTTEEVAAALETWFLSPENGQRRILFWTGHGQKAGTEFFLATRNSPGKIRSAQQAIEMGSISRLIADSPATKILIVIDGCFAGEGLSKAASVLLSELSFQPPEVDGDRGVGFLFSAHALEQAEQGVFCGVLADVLYDGKVQRIWSDEDRYIDFDRLSSALREELKRRQIPQSITPTSVGYTLELLPNPRYRANLLAEDVETRRRREAEERVGEHFHYSSRGIETQETGWYFTGRRQLLTALVRWLDTADGGIRVVTGLPGSGKSAVMGRLATLSDPNYRELAEQDGILADAAPETVPSAGLIDVAIHAKGKTLDDCARAIASALDIEVRTRSDLTVDIKALLTSVAKLGHRVTILIDALDEAAFGHDHRIAKELIIPLGELPRTHVLVGTRRSLDGKTQPEGRRHEQLRAVFGEAVLIDDLADEPSTREDVADYVQIRLQKQSPHAHAAIAAAAQRVAEKAGDSFLYARVVSRTLQEADTLDGPLPDDALAAFAYDIETRFGEEAPRVHRLLAALAWGLGKGLTRRVWPKVAAAVSIDGTGTSDEDVSWVLSKAGWHIIETGEDGQAVYRFVHQAFADHYRAQAEQAGISEADAHRRISLTLSDGITGGDWLDTDRYLWRSLASHAVQGKVLDRILTDPGFLSVVKPDSLLPHLSRIEDETAKRIVTVYNWASHLLPETDPIERMAYLHLKAQMEDPDLASRLEPPIPGRWRCQWANTRPTTPHRVLEGHGDRVTSVTFGVLNRAPVIVSGSHDRTVRLWDARSGQALNVLEGHRRRVTSVAFGVVDGVPVIVSGSDDRTVRLWDARSGQTLRLLKGHKGEITSVAFGVFDGAPVIVSGSKDKTARLWDARSGETLRVLEGHSNWVSSIALGVLDGAPVIVSGGWNHLVHIWDARSGDPLRLLEGHDRPVISVALGNLDGAPAIVSGSQDQTVRLWDALKTRPGIQRWLNSLFTRTGSALNVLQGHGGGATSVAFGEFDGVPVIVSGSYDKTVRLWDARSGQTLRVLEGHGDLVTSVALSVADGAPAILSGSGDKTVRLWDARPGQALHAFEGHWVNSIAFGVVGGAPVIVSGSDDRTVRLWDARSGQALRALEGHGSRVTSVAFGVVNGVPMIVSGSDDRTVRLWDARSGRTIRALKGHWKRITSVAFGVVDGVPVIVSGSWDQSVRLWDARSGRALRIFEDHQNWVSSVVLGVVDGVPVIVSGSHDRTVRLWDARSGQALRALKGHGGRVTSVAFGVVDGVPVIVSGSWDHSVRLWDARSGHTLRVLEGYGHGERKVESVAFSVLDGAPVIISESGERAAHLWDARSGKQLCNIRLEQHPLVLNLDEDGNLVIGTERGILLFKL